MGLPTGPLAYWLNTAKRLVAPVEGRITHNQWIRDPSNAAKLGVTIEEAAQAHPNLVTVRQLGRNIDINPMADGRITDDQLNRIRKMMRTLDVDPNAKVRIGDSVGNLYESPSFMDFLDTQRVRDLPQGYEDGGPVHMQAGGNDFSAFRTPKHAGMTHTFSSAGEPYRDKYGTEMTSVKGQDGKYYLRENAGVEAPMLDPLDPFMLPKTAPLAALRAAMAAGRGVGRLGAEGVARAVESGNPLLGAALPNYVVKPKGGNWLNNSVENALNGLKRQQPTTEAEISSVESSDSAPDIRAIITAMKAYHNA